MFIRCKWHKRYLCHLFLVLQQYVDWVAAYVLSGFDISSVIQNLYQ